MSKSIVSINLAILILFSFVSLVYSDIITLKTGRTIEGLIVQEDKEEVVVKISIGTTTLKKDQILKIDYEPDYLLNLADGYFKEKDYKKAIKIYKEILNNYKDRDSSAIKYKIAQCQLNLGLFDEAILSLEEIKEAPQLKEKVDSLLQQAKEKKERELEAKREAERIRKEREERANFLYKQAEEEYNKIKALKWHYTNLAKYNKAIDDCNKIIEDYPKIEVSLKAQYLIIQCYEQQAEYEKKSKALDKYVDMTAKRNPDKAATILKDLGDNQFKSKEYRIALKYYNYVIERFPSYNQIDYIQLRIALCYSQDYNYKRAMSVYKKFIKDYPQSRYLNKAYKGLSEIYYIVYKSKKAISLLKKLLKEAPQKAKPDIHINIAKIYYNMKEFDKAKKGFEEAIRLYPDSPLLFVAQKYIRKIQGGNKKD